MTFVRSLIVVLSLMMVGMAVTGCDDTPEDPLNGRSVDEKYWGKYTIPTLPGRYLIISATKLIIYDPDRKIQETLVYSDGKTLYGYEFDRPNSWGVFGAFDIDDTEGTFVFLSNTRGIWTRGTE